MMVNNKVTIPKLSNFLQKILVTTEAKDNRIFNIYQYQLAELTFIPSSHTLLVVNQCKACENKIEIYLNFITVHKVFFLIDCQEKRGRTNDDNRKILDLTALKMQPKLL